MNFYAFFSYILLAAFTPGPNNITLMSGAGRYGFKKAMRFCAGAVTGFFIITTIAAVATSTLYSLIPTIEPYMVYAGAAYILWLAYSVFRDKGGGGEDGGDVSVKFTSGLILQFINVKVILYTLTTMSTFVIPNYKSVPAIAAFVILLSLTGCAANICWAGFGVVFERIFKKHRMIMNGIMALLLIFCAVSLIWK